MSSVAILIPTLYRSHKLQDLIQNIRQVTPQEHATYFMVPKDDRESIDILNIFDQKYWTDSNDMRYVKRIQFMYENTNEEFIFTGADDLNFHYDWLCRALKAFLPQIGVVVLNDMHNPNGTNFMIRRSYIENESGVLDAPNTVFHQGYFHNYCDTEFIATASKRGVISPCRGVVEHMHPHAGKGQDDPIYALARKHEAEDAKLFSERSHLWT